MQSSLSQPRHSRLASFRVLCICYLPMPYLRFTPASLSVRHAAQENRTSNLLIAPPSSQPILSSTLRAPHKRHGFDMNARVLPQVKLYRSRKPLAKEEGNKTTADDRLTTSIFTRAFQAMGAVGSLQYTGWKTKHGHIGIARRKSQAAFRPHPCPKSDLGTKHVHACSGVCVT